MTTTRFVMRSFNVEAMTPSESSFWLKSERFTVILAIDNIHDSGTSWSSRAAENIELKAAQTLWNTKSKESINALYMSDYFVRASQFQEHMFCWTKNDHKKNGCKEHNDKTHKICARPFFVLLQDFSIKRSCVCVRFLGFLSLFFYCIYFLANCRNAKCSAQHLWYADSSFCF